MCNHNSFKLILDDPQAALQHPLWNIIPAVSIWGYKHVCLQVAATFIKLYSLRNKTRRRIRVSISMVTWTKRCLSRITDGHTSSSYEGWNFPFIFYNVLFIDFFPKCFILGTFAMSLAPPGNDGRASWCGILRFHIQTKPTVKVLNKYTEACLFCWPLRARPLTFNYSAFKCSLHYIQYASNIIENTIL